MLAITRVCCHIANSYTLISLFMYQLLHSTVLYYHLLSPAFLQT